MNFLENQEEKRAKIDGPVNNGFYQIKVINTAISFFVILFFRLEIKANYVIGLVMFVSFPTLMPIHFSLAFFVCVCVKIEA